MTLPPDADAPSFQQRSFFWSGFTALEALLLCISALSYHPEHIRTLVCLYLLSFLPFLAGLHAGAKISVSIRIIFLTGMIYRLTVLASFPVFSDDVFRYLFEGQMQLQGVNPYLAAPADPAAAGFRDGYFDRVNHKMIPTIYPPLSQLFFRACAAAFYNLTFFKTVLVLLDLSVLFLLQKMVVNRGMQRRFLLIWAWHPLVIVEIAGSGHQDIIGIFFLTGSLWFLRRNRLPASALMLTGSFLAKLFPAALLPLLLRKKPKWPYLLFAALAVLFYLPFLSTDLRIFTGLSTYARTWEANASIFYLLKQLPGEDLQNAKMVILLIFLAITGYTYRSIPDFEQAGGIVLGSYMILTPTLHPWYLLWMIPFLVLRCNTAWLYLSMASTAYYHVLIDYFEKGIWQEELWIKALIYFPFFVLLFRQGGRIFFSRKKPHA